MNENELEKVSQTLVVLAKQFKLNYLTEFQLKDEIKMIVNEIM